MSYRRRNTKNKHNCKVLFEAKTGEEDGLEFICFDTETTGLKADIDYIVELACLKYRVVKPGTIKKIDTLHIYMKPPIYMSENVVAVHHITNEFLADKPTEAECFPKIKEFFGDHPIVTGYNVGFDVGMISALYKRCGGEFNPVKVLDVLEFARDLVSIKDITDFLKDKYRDSGEFAEAMKTPYRLGNLVNLYGVEKGITFHSAIDDTEATVRLLVCLYSEYRDQAVQTSFMPVHINFVYYFKGFNKEQSGVWLDTDLGKIYYSTFLKAWISATVNLDMIDIDRLENNVLGMLGITLEELGKMTEKRYKALRSRS